VSTVAEQIVDVLRHAGVARVYGVVGDGLNPLVDAIRCTERIAWTHVRNEEAGPLAAVAEAQVAGRLAVCAGSRGPKSIHLMGRRYDTCRSGMPVPAKRRRGAA